MLRITKLSGEELSLPLTELSDVKALKQRLSREHGLPPRFRQRLLHEGKELDDAVKLDTVMDLQVLIVAISEVSRDQEKELCKAASTGNVAQAETLLQLPMDPDVIDKEGFTPLMLTAKQDRGDVAELLLEAGADKDWHSLRTGLTALMCAATTHSAQVAQLLLEAGACTDVCDDVNGTALMLAAREGHAEVVQLLLEAGAQTELRDGYLQHGTALMLAAYNDHTSVVQLLLQFGAHVDASDNRGSTALMHAARNGHGPSVRLLLEAGAAKDARNDWGDTALTLADPEVRLLLQASPT